ncbi:MAG: FkbM family methyltransferase [Candidatus Parcubacteria bacterium]|nr:FkbM family methyltransferase [Candidatus Parcubacteria bacterium]
MKLNNLHFNNQDFKVYTRSQADKSIMKEIFELREYKEVETIIKSAKETIIDAGAQAGFFVLYCRALNPEVKILAIEPDEDNLELLNQHLEINNLKNIEVMPAALAAKSGLRDFFISSDSHNHSLFRVLVPKINKNAKVKTYSLDDLLKEQGIEKVALLKLDIEGAEYEVLGNFTYWEKIKNIALEYHDFGDLKHQELEKILVENGFKVKSRSSKFDRNLGFIFAVK